MFTKHRNEVEIYRCDFAAELAVDETLSTPIARVKKAVLGAWDDVTADLESGAVTVVGTAVQFTLKAGTNVTQTSEDKYMIYVSCNTSQGRTLVETIRLTITDVAV